MKITCRGIEYDLDKNDTIMFNGSCYMIITRKTLKGYWPEIPKTTAKKLIKDGKLEFTGTQKIIINVDLYKVNEE